MEGKPLVIEGLDLTPYRGKLLLLYTWSTKRDDSMRYVSRMRELFPGVAVLGINIDTDTADAGLGIQRLSPAERAEQRLDGGGLSGPLASQLRIYMHASIYIIDADGILRDVCGHLGLRGKLAALAEAMDPAAQSSHKQGGEK
jgi:hypothetical protein